MEIRSNNKAKHRSQKLAFGIFRLLSLCIVLILFAILGFIIYKGVDGKRLRNTASLHDHGRNLRVVSVEQLHTPVKHPLCGIRNSIHEDGLVPDDSEVGIALVGQGKIDMRRLEGENDADRGIPVAGRNYKKILKRGCILRFR